MADDLSDLLDDETPEETADEVFVLSVDDGELDLSGEERIFVGGVEYLRADAIRAGFNTKVWQAAIQLARRTPGISTTEIERVRDLIEEGR